MVYFIVTLLFIIIASLIFLVCLYNKVYMILAKLILAIPSKTTPIIDKHFKTGQFRVRASKKLEIVGYRVDLPRPAKAIIIICHNLGGNKEGMWKYAEFLCEAGYISICFDFLNHGESSINKKLYFNHKAELKTIMEYIKGMNHEGLPIGILGLSMGSLAGLLHYTEDKNIKAIILDGGPLLHVKDYPEYVVKINGVKNHLMQMAFVHMCMLITDLGQIYKKTIKALKLLKDRPILLIQGEKDFMCHPRNTEEALSIINSPLAERWVVKGANHLMGFYMAKEEYKERVVGFFDKYLTKT